MSKIKKRMNPIRVQELKEQEFATIQEISEAYGLADSSVSKMVITNAATEPGEKGKVLSYKVPGIKTRWVDVNSFDSFRESNHVDAADVIKVLRKMRASGEGSTTPNRG